LRSTRPPISPSSGHGASHVTRKVRPGNPERFDIFATPLPLSKCRRFLRVRAQRGGGRAGRWVIGVKRMGIERSSTLPPRPAKLGEVASRSEAGEGHFGGLLIPAFSSADRGEGAGFFRRAPVNANGAAGGGCSEPIQGSPFQVFAGV
jgi:hypothetical protein